MSRKFNKFKLNYGKNVDNFVKNDNKIIARN